MSKSAGGGGLKGHDKGGSGSCKVVKKQASLEAALDKVADAFLCPAGHRMKLHQGSKREGPLTCDGDDDVCCGRDGDGVIYVGFPRYSCEACDFDICESCCEAETAPELTPEQQREAARQRLREKTGRGGRGPNSKAAPTKEEEEAAALAAKRAEIAAKVAEAKAAAAAALAAPTEAVATAPATAPASAGDAALRAAVESNDLERLKSCINDQAAAGTASAEVLSDARKARDKLQAKARKAAQKQKQKDKDATPEQTDAPASPAEEQTPPEAVSTPSKVSFSAAPAEEVAPAVTPPPATGGFAFNWSMTTASGKADDSDDSDDDEEEEEEADEADEAKGAKGREVTYPLQAPEHPLVCPFTQAVMSDPVILADGHTYERKPAEEYLKAHDRSPRTGEKLAHKSVLPNLMALELCQAARALEL